jgi:hypothetical protein
MAHSAERRGSNASACSAKTYGSWAEACSICLETPHDPVTTHCQHKFCRSCLKQYVRICPKSQPVPCPLCRAVLANAPAVSNAPPEEETVDVSPAVDLEGAFRRPTRDVPRVPTRELESGPGSGRRTQPEMEPPDGDRPRISLPQLVHSVLRQHGGAPNVDAFREATAAASMAPTSADARRAMMVVRLRRRLNDLAQTSSTEAELTAEQIVDAITEPIPEGDESAFDGDEGDEADGNDDDAVAAAAAAAAADDDDDEGEGGRYPGARSSMSLPLLEAGGSTAEAPGPAQLDGGLARARFRRMDDSGGMPLVERLYASGAGTGRSSTVASAEADAGTPLSRATSVPVTSPTPRGGSSSVHDGGSGSSPPGSPPTEPSLMSRTAPPPSQRLPRSNSRGGRGGFHSPLARRRREAELCRAVRASGVRFVIETVLERRSLPIADRSGFESYWRWAVALRADDIDYGLEPTQEWVLQSGRIGRHWSPRTLSPEALRSADGALACAVERVIFSDVSPGTPGWKSQTAVRGGGGRCGATAVGGGWQSVWVHWERSAAVGRDAHTRGALDLLGPTMPRAETTAGGGGDGGFPRSGMISPPLKPSREQLREAERHRCGLAVCCPGVLGPRSRRQSGQQFQLQVTVVWRAELGWSPTTIFVELAAPEAGAWERGVGEEEAKHVRHFQVHVGGAGGAAGEGQ